MDEGDQPSEVERRWHRFLQDAEVARNHWLVHTLSLGPPAPMHNPMLDGVLASQLTISLTALLDKALEERRKQLDRRFPRGAKRDLHGRIEALRDDLVSPDALHELRDRRNTVAHEPGAYASWEELDEAVGLVEHELQKAGFVSDRPRYEFVVSRSRAKASSKPGYAWEQEWTFGLKEQGEWVVEMRAVTSVGSSSA